MRSWSFPVGRLLGADFRLHLSFVLLLAYVWMAEALRGMEFVGRGAELAALVLLSVTAHELAHLAVARWLQLAPRAVLLFPFGGVNLIVQPGGAAGAAPSRWQREVRIAVAGPLLSLVLAAIAACLVAIAGSSLLQQPVFSASDLLRSFFWINAAVAAFNLLPAYPLDGGRILRALLSCKLPEEVASRRSVAVSQAFSMALMLAGFWSAWLLLGGVFLFIGAQLEEHNLMFQAVLDTVRLEDVMLTEFAVLSPADTLQDALTKALHTLQDDFPVVRGADMVGTISRQSITRALRSHGNGYVQSAMNRVYEVAQRHESLANVFRKITGQQLIPVVDEERLVGIVTFQNLMRSMALLAESRRLKRREEEQD
ncbi:MAG TPA: site-2 protease family protein [Terriglobales bacterium]|nr:site-2 protease family protein [Terriglobales bacterium]